MKRWWQAALIAVVTFVAMRAMAQTPTALPTPSCSYTREGVYFHGASYVEVSNVTSFPTTTFTLEYWLNVTNSWTLGDTIFSKWDQGTSEKFMLNLGGDGAAYRFYVFMNGTGVAQTSAYQYRNDGGSFVFVAVVYNGNAATDEERLKIYVNGVNVGSNMNPVPTSLTYGAEHFLFGGHPGRTAYPRHYGDEMRIYSVAKSAAQITADYNSGIGTCGLAGETGLYAGWHLDEGSGTDVADYSGNGHGGVLNGTVVTDYDWSSSGFVCCGAPTPTPTSVTVTATPTNTVITATPTNTPVVTATPTITSTGAALTVTPTATATSLTPTWTPRSGGPYLCRSGRNHGAPCGLDSNCPTDATPAADGGYGTGQCTLMAHARVCVSKNFCMVNDAVSCMDSTDCPTWPTNVLDYCPFRDPSGKACATDGDCGMCTTGAGINRGLGCTQDSDCGPGTCNKAADGAACANGLAQGQAMFYTDGPGVAGDEAADYAIGNTSTESDAGDANSARSMWRPLSIFIDGVANRFWVWNRAYQDGRIMIWDTSNPTAYSTANHFVGALDATYTRWQLIPGDNNIAQTAQRSARGLEGGYYGDFQRCAKAPVSNAVWCSDGHRILKFPTSAQTGENATSWLGTTNITTITGSDTITGRFGGIDIAGICTTDQITTCTSNADCGAGTCKEWLAASDVTGNRVMVWTDLGAAAKGGAPNYYLGQSGSTLTWCNRRQYAPGQNTLCAPQGVRFGRGYLTIADTGNNRVVSVATTTITADGVNFQYLTGQADWTSTTAQAGTGGLSAPTDVSYDPTYAHLYAIADYANNRVTVYNTFAGGAVACLGQASCAANGFNTGTTCNGYYWPFGVEFAGDGNLWVADMGNHRVLRVDASLTTGKSASVLLGQPVCAPTPGSAVNTMPGVASGHTFSSVAGEYNGIAFFNNPYVGSGYGVCVSDHNNNRVLCWDDWTTVYNNGHPIERDADAVLGQTNATNTRANQGGSAGSNTLYLPQYIAASSNYLYVADAYNNRVLAYSLATNAHRLTTNQGAAKVYGQPNMTSTVCGGSPALCASGTVCDKTLCNPTAVDVSANDSMVLITSWNEGRVLYYINGSTTSLHVLGKPTLDSTTNLCSSPSAYSLCYPWAVAIDAAGGRVYVSDQGPGTYGRVLQYATSSLAVGTNPPAEKVYGNPAGTTGAAFGAYPVAALCDGGTSSGLPCTEKTLAEIRPQGTASAACPGGYCTWQLGPIAPGGIAVHPTQNRFWVGVGGGAVYEYVNGSYVAFRVAGENAPYEFGNFGTGYVTTQWAVGGGGMRYAPNGDLWVFQNGNSESIRTVYGLAAPAGAVPTATVTVGVGTPTPTGAPAATPTPTSIPCIVNGDCPAGYSCVP